MGTDVDLFVGKRIRRRRRLLGMTQQQLAALVGVRFQQIQKYECGGNRVTASRLHALSTALSLKSVDYFFEGLAGNGTPPANDPGSADNPLPSDVLYRAETLELVRTYYRLNERPRKRLLELAKAMEADAQISVNAA